MLEKHTSAVVLVVILISTSLYVKVSTQEPPQLDKRPMLAVKSGASVQRGLHATVLYVCIGVGAVSFAYSASAQGAITLLSSILGFCANGSNRSVMSHVLITLGGLSEDIPIFNYLSVVSLLYGTLTNPADANIRTSWKTAIHAWRIIGSLTTGLGDQFIRLPSALVGPEQRLGLNYR